MPTRRDVLSTFGAVTTASLAAGEVMAQASLPPGAPLIDLPAPEKILQADQSAIVVVDFQNSFAHKEGDHYKRFKTTLEKTNMVDISVNFIKKARALGIQIIHVTEAYTHDYRELDKGNAAGFHRSQLVRQAWKVGTWPTLLYDPIKPGPDDNDIHLPNRLTLSGFGTNGLDYILKNKYIRNVAILGFTSDVCCYATTLAAYDLGYRVYAIADGMIGADEAAHNAMMKFNYPILSRVMNSNEFLGMFPQKT